MSELANIFDSAQVKEWVRDISGSEVNGTTLAGASHYAAGDFTGLHTDRAGGVHAKEKRRIAYILHLTDNWNPKFGGDMVWMNPAYVFHPSFNSLTIFSVSESSWHYVSPVAAITPSNIRRLAFSGWWVSSNIHEAEEIEAKMNNDEQLESFATVVDGTSGNLIPHREAYGKIYGLWPNYAE